ncbi:hypothetical protein AAG906_015596 [Vitis piasezkii]
MESKKKSLLLELQGFLLLNVLMLCMARKHITTVDWVVKEASYTRLCSTKKILTVNGLFPGPAIYMRRGDRLKVNVRNAGEYNVTIHWANFTYEIVLSNEEGTIWWHAHSDWSRATVHGFPFAKPHKAVPIVLASWFKGDVMEIIETALENGGEPNKSDAFTINGQPGDLYNCSKEGTFKMVVDYGKTYLLRIINSIMNEEMFFMVANHNLTVSPSHYYMASRAYAELVFDNTTTTAILQYSGNYTAPSTPSFPNLPNFADIDSVTNFTRRLKALATKDYPVDVPQSVDTRLYITISVNTLPCANNSCDGPNGTRLSASLNNISFVEPSIDVLQAYYRTPYSFNFTGDNLPNTLLTPEQGTKVKVLDYNSTVEIVFQGTNVLNGAENHPMHLHGYSFYLVGYGFGNFNNETDPKSYNLVDPPEVNTIGVPTKGWAAIRFRADNPGVWFMHCHLERHASWGMDTVLIVKNGRTRLTSMRQPPRQLNPC